ncbi:Proteolipid membrane potential modulator domain containing protein [Tylopilus felleus]
MAGEADTFLLIILALIFPPASVAVMSGCGADLCLNILLTILGYLPGCFHAFWLVIKRTEANEMYGYRNWRYAGMGRYVSRQGAPPPAPYGQGPPPPPPPPPPAPPPGQYPAGGAPPPTSQAPVDQKGGSEAPPPPPPADQKYTVSAGDQAPSQAPTDQKQADPPAQSTAPTGGT